MSETTHCSNARITIVLPLLAWWFELGNEWASDLYYSGVSKWVCTYSFAYAKSLATMKI